MTLPVVLITGGSGMLGRALTARLARDYVVVGLDVSEPQPDVPYDSVHYLDVTSPMSAQYALHNVRERYGTRLAAVVHLAAYYDLSGEDSPKYEQVTIRGTERLLRMLEPFELERFVFSSTMLVHRPVKPGQLIHEDSPLGASWAYPASKIETERVIREHHPPVRYTLLRIAGVYTGFGKQPTLVQQIERIRERDFKSFFFPGDSEAGQALVHLDDAVEALALAVERRAELPDGPILIGEPEVLGYAELQDRIGRLVWGHEWPTVRVPAPLAKAAAWIEEKTGEGSFIKPYMIELADDHYALDITRAREWLGWEPRHRLADELPEMIETMRAYPVAWQQANGLAPEDAAEVEPVGT
ncbi:MAG TPA: NAD(P)-dependent oxidoreductase [Longimicrobiales bacterium]|nr:NAD(P)-dependent oxidoreductase [Longimicrobiales bacterium]